MDLGDGVTAQEWAPIRKGCSWYATSDGQYFIVGDGETPAEAYEQLLEERERCACLSFTNLAGPDDTGTGQTHVTSEDYTIQESK